MFKNLQAMKDNDKIGDFLFPSLPKKIKGRVSFLSKEAVWIESKVGTQVYQYITHPNNVCIVQRKS